MLMKPVRDDTIVAGDLTFHYVKWGEQGRPIVGIHGLTANAFSFQAWADGLATGYQFYAHDLRGRGDSDKPEHGYSVPIHAADLAHLIDAWGLERPILIGHSLGALIALYFAAHYPDKLSKLVLVDAGAPLPWRTPEEQPAWLTASINRLGTPVPSFEEYIQLLKLAPFIGPYWNEYFELYFENDVRHNSDGSVASKCHREGVLEEGKNYDEARPQDQWVNVQAPTLLLRAGQGLFFDNDQLLSEADAAAVQQGIKHCQFVNFPTLNHYTILLGSENGPVKAVRTFLDQE
jgi:pimeloyl-ACP methyl ester carboxylesterase